MNANETLSAGAAPEHAPVRRKRRRSTSRGWTFKRVGRPGKKRKHGKVRWYVGYIAPDGQKIREVAGDTENAANDLLKQRLGELNAGHDPTKPLTFDDLLVLVKADWRNRGRKSTLTTPSGQEQSGIRRLRETFGRTEVAAITALALEKYSDRRQDDEGAAVSTVRNELNVLKHGMYFAKRLKLLAAVPAFPALNPNNVRKGFFERHELDAILAELPELDRPIALFLYWTGWRRGEVLSREWRHVDFGAGVIRLEPGETKNGEGRTLPFDALPQLCDVLHARRAYTDAVERRTGQVVPWVFHREGRQVKSFRSAWRAACKRLALRALAVRHGTTPRALWKAMSREERLTFRGIDRRPHDFRRTAVRNLVRAGVSEKVAMGITGHKTRSVFDRYNIVNEQDLRDAVAKLAAASGDRQVASLLDAHRTRKAAGTGA